MNSHYLSLEEAAKFLCVSVSKLYKMTHNRELRYHKVGRLNLFKIDDLEDYLQRHCVASVEELRGEAYQKMKGGHKNGK